MKKHLLLSAIVFGAAAAFMSAQQAPGAASFTAAQATSGRGSYDQNCAGCHGPELRNGGAPALAGPDFIGGWSTRPVRDLISTIRASMPSDRPGQLREEVYLDIVAYILQVNGRAPGDQMLTVNTSRFEVAVRPSTAPPASTRTTASPVSVSMSPVAPVTMIFTVFPTFRGDENTRSSWLSLARDRLSAPSRECFSLW